MDYYLLGKLPVIELIKENKLPENSTATQLIEIVPEEEHHD
jgi:hypothetical protein